MARARKMMARMPSEILMTRTSSWVKVKTKLSIYPSTCEDIGSRHAVRCHLQSLKRRDAMSIPPVVIGDIVSSESARQSVSSEAKIPKSI